MTDERNQQVHGIEWYVSVEDRTVGPVTTDLLIRGLTEGRVPPDAMVCPVGGSEWSWVSEVGPFAEVVRRSCLSPQQQHPPVSLEESDAETLVKWGARAEPPHEEVAASRKETARSRREREPSLFGVDPAFAKAAAAAPPHLAPSLLGDGEDTSAGDRGSSQAPRFPPATHSANQDDAGDIPVEIEMAIDWDDESVSGAQAVIDWSQPFVGQMDVSGDVRLPPERALLNSLASVPPTELVAQEVLWNITLCVAYGSSAVAQAAAGALFEAVQKTGATARLEWIARVLLSKGFMPSGIPAEIGLRGVRVLRDHCPAELRVQLEDAVLK